MVSVPETKNGTTYATLRRSFERIAERTGPSDPGRLRVDVDGIDLNISPAIVAATFGEVVLWYSDMRDIARYELRLHWEATDPAVNVSMPQITHGPADRASALRQCAFPNIKGMAANTSTNRRAAIC